MKIIALLFALLPLAQAQKPISLHPANPHYYDFRGRPTVLITSAEHYGAVLNLDFDYRRYLDALAADKLNLTRIFTGAYREFPGDFNIHGNTLAPKPGRYITPWAEAPGGKWDLSKWNPAYFARLKDFFTEASKRGIVVEVTLFTAYYNAQRWQECPLYIDRNGNGVGNAKFDESLTLRHPSLVEAQSAMVRKIVTELNAFDNVIYEICNEPYFAGIALDWQRHIARVVSSTEKTLPNRHLIAQNIANHQGVISDPDPEVSVFHFHYARPPVAVDQNYGLNRVIGFDESGFDGSGEAIYRIQGWDFILAGGAHYNNLDYSFIAGHEDGSFPVPAANPGYGSPELRKQLSYLAAFMNGLNFVRMAPVRDLIAAGIPENASARALAEPGRQYAVYLHHGRTLAGHKPNYVVGNRRSYTQLELRLPAGQYKASWLNPRNGKTEREETFTHTGGTRVLASPAYQEDLALKIVATER
jgi:hypothetical protein